MISYHYEKISIALNGEITVNVLTIDDTRPGDQVEIEQVFASGTNVAAIDSAIAAATTKVWSLQTS